MNKLKKLSKRNRWLLATGALSLIAVASAYAASFGTQVSVSNVTLQNVWSGRYGPTYITFTPATLAGCHNGAGGYLSSTWSEAMADLPGQPDISNRQLAALLFAKGTGQKLSIYYRVNATGTGWDKCAIDSIWFE